MEVKNILLETVGHLFDLDQLMTIVFVEYALDADCMRARPAEVLYRLISMPWTCDCSLSQSIQPWRSWLSICYGLRLGRFPSLLSVVDLDETQQLLVLVELVRVSIGDGYLAGLIRAN